MLSKDGRRVALAQCDARRRREVGAKLAVGDVVERYLQDGDPVVLNGQPSLHKSSMQGHLAVGKS